MILYLIRLSTGIVQGTKRVYYSVPERIDGQLWDPQEVLPTQVALFILVQTKEPVNYPQLYWRGHLVCSVSICFWLKPVSS